MYDREAVRFFDIAHEGAFIRGAATLIHDGWAKHLKDLRPRSVIVVVGDDVSRAAAEFAIALLKEATLPITVVSQLPRFAGALDVVLVASVKAMCPQERCLHTAVQRGCSTVLIAPPQGPLREEAPTAVTVVPVPPNAAGGSPASLIACIYALVTLLVQPEQAVAESLELAAQEVDEELIAVSPERDELVNEARSLSAYVGKGRVVHTGSGALPSALARLIATLWTVKGRPSAAIELEELMVVLPEIQADYNNDIFFDPFEADEAPVIPLRFIVWAQHETQLPHAIAQSSGGQELTLESSLRLMVRGLAAAIL